MDTILGEVYDCYVWIIKADLLRSNFQENCGGRHLSVFSHF
jgi:hypothetical protein